MFKMESEDGEGDQNMPTFTVNKMDTVNIAMKTENQASIFDQQNESEVESENMFKVESGDDEGD